VNILLTGGTGYIGSHTAVVLIESGFNVILFDNLSNSQRDVVFRIENITQKAIPFVEGDVRDIALVSRTLRDYQVNAVIHFAGLKAVGESVSDPLKYYDNNVVGTIKLLEAMHEIGIKKLVFSSSATVYGEPKYLPYDEDHPTSAINPYGRTKLQIEDLLKDLANSDDSWSVAVLRYFNPIGAHKSGLIGEDPQGVPNNLMPYILDVAAGVYPYVRVFGNDYPTHDGTGIRDYIHVMDLADGHLSALQFLIGNYGWHAFNLGSGKGVSVLEIIHTFNSVNNVHVEYEILPRRSGDLPEYFSSADKADNILGWRPSRTLEDMCESAWNWRKETS